MTGQRGHTLKLFCPLYHQMVSLAALWCSISSGILFPRLLLAPLAAVSSYFRSA